MVGSFVVRIPVSTSEAILVPEAMTLVIMKWRWLTRCGEVVAVLYDCYGDFSGFVLDECCDRHVFETRERSIGKLVLITCREDMRLCVTVDEVCGWIVRLAVTG